MVRMKANRLFTVNSPFNGAILHGDDRKEADALARYPDVSERDAQFLENHPDKLASRYDGKIDDDDGEAGDVSIGERAGNMVEANADAEASVDATTGLSTRDTTAFAQPIEEMAGAQSARTIVAEDSTTAAPADEAPASGSETTRTASRSGRSRS
jgi:hypothetical protein